ncbi:hypothetical protein BWR22_09880 [Lacinutrix venerupis]|uniref:Uncharacterized protein n=1 Tax=Lacinutrix venerupis TaxID=1486034 RepID=A0AAC9LNC0_9FLAO|nr:hypothetical protein BWR22_09880 [Lacinutrix venerupis]
MSFKEIANSYSLIIKYYFVNSISVNKAIRFFFTNLIFFKHSNYHFNKKISYCSVCFELFANIFRLCYKFFNSSIFCIFGHQFLIDFRVFFNLKKYLKFKRLQTKLTQLFKLYKTELILLYEYL